jgi:hypothetical protein
VKLNSDGTITIPGLFIGCPATGGNCLVRALVQTDGKVSGKLVVAKHKKKKARRHVLGHHTYVVPAGSMTAVKVKLSKGTRRLLRKHGKLRAVAHLDVTGLDSHKRTQANRKFTLKGKKKHKKHHAKAASHARMAELRRDGVLAFFAEHRGSGSAYSPWQPTGSR